MSMYDEDRGGYQQRNRDTYFFDLVKEVGLDVNDPADWNNISNFFREISHIDSDT